jgi:hypothetical protein
MTIDYKIVGFFLISKQTPIYGKQRVRISIIYHSIFNPINPTLQPAVPASLKLPSSLFELPTSLFELRRTRRRDKTTGQDDQTGWLICSEVCLYRTVIAAPQMLPKYFNTAFLAQLPGKVDRHIACRIFLGPLSQNLR